MRFSRVSSIGLALLALAFSEEVRAQSFSGRILVDFDARGNTNYDIYLNAGVAVGGTSFSSAYASFGGFYGQSYGYLGVSGVAIQISNAHKIGGQWIADSIAKSIFNNTTGAYDTSYSYDVALASSNWIDGKAACGTTLQTVQGTITGYDLIPNAPPASSVAVVGHNSGDLVLAGTTISVYYDATDANSNLSGIRCNAWNAATGFFDNGGGTYIAQSGNSGQIVKTFTISPLDDWYFWTEAVDASGETASTPSYTDGFHIKSYVHPIAYSTPDYEPGYWNADDYIQGNNNCYNYCNNKRTDTFAQPGRASGHMWTNIDATEIRAGAISDGLEPTDASSISPEGKTKMALVIAPGYDYHWYRQDSDGKWSHKIGPIPATNLDNSGAVITNPETADRWRYTEFVGYFFTPSDRLQGQGHANIN